jgi:D-glycero-D-manno-heptose 1,7-bisphosphate phosphatase
MIKALFLDRDGVINIDKHYVYKITDFEFIEGIFELCKNYQANGYLIIIITNQAGIARGFYNHKDFAKLTLWMTERFTTNGVAITKVYYCPHHPEFGAACNCRKPNPGMILKAQHEFNINLSESVLIGDKESDLAAGRNAGINKLILMEPNMKLSSVKIFE